MIKRVGGAYPLGRSQSTSYKDLVWTVATASNENLNLTEQTFETLSCVESSLVELGSDKSRIVSAQVYLANINDKPIMDKVWAEWIGSNPDHWPQRACVGVDLGGHWLIEVTVTAVRVSHHQ